MIISQQLVEEVDGFRAHKPLVVGIHEALPWFLGESAEDVVVLSVEFDVILVEIFKELVGTKYLCDLHELI